MVKKRLSRRLHSLGVLKHTACGAYSGEELRLILRSLAESICALMRVLSTTYFSSRVERLVFKGQYRMETVAIVYDRTCCWDEEPFPLIFGLFLFCCGYDY